MKAVNLHEGIDSTLLILQNRLKASSTHTGIHIVKEYGELPLVECYAGQVNQVFMNILSNAIDALEDPRSQAQSTIPPTIRINTTALGADRVVIRFIDNGPGIPEASRQRLFDPFFTTKPVGKGTGLGLSISYQIIVEKHGGTLECESTLGLGTEFRVEIPVQPNLVKSEPGAIAQFHAS
jgi:two-component system, NtrC family, sensor kinase